MQTAAAGQGWAVEEEAAAAAAAAAAGVNTAMVLGDKLPSESESIWQMAAGVRDGL